jgi:hypothetical protein
MNYSFKAILNNQVNTRYFSTLSYMTAYLYNNVPMNQCDMCLIVGVPEFQERSAMLFFNYHGNGSISANNNAAKVYLGKGT